MMSEVANRLFAVPDQLRTVINVIGTPTEEDIASIANGRNEKV